jgi:sodium-coupled monocarboxylate transporter 8/12
MASAAEFGESLKYFSVADYAVFSFMLAICTFIGLYFGYQDYKGRKNVPKEAHEEAANYLMGGRDMPLIPIALSLTASFVSGTVLLGELLPKEFR